MKSTCLLAFILIPAAALAADTGTETSRTSSSDVSVSSTSSKSAANQDASKTSSSSSAKTARIQEINTHQGQWMNKKVTVSGQVIQSTPDLLVIDGKGLFNDRILVINSSAKKKGKKASTNSDEGTTAASADTRNFSTNSDVTVPGTVRRMTLSEVKREYIANPPEEITTEYTSAMPVIVTDFKNIQTASSSDMNRTGSGATSQQ